MVAIIKAKVVYAGLMKSDTYAKDISLVWLYKTIDEALHKGSQINEASLNREGYKLMRRGKDVDQYAVDLSFKGDKNIIYLAIEKELRPFIRESLLTEILN